MAQNARLDIPLRMIVYFILFRRLDNQRHHIDFFIYRNKLYVTDENLLNIDIFETSLP